MRLPIRNIIFFLVFIVGGVVLQKFLSKRKNKWLGIVLPLITFIFSLIGMLNIASTGDLGETTVLVITTLLLMNIPTIILLAIYFSCQKTTKEISEIDKMNIQDLE
ncbi:MAG: hypothetical protein WCZ27_09250 [Tissierellaceae bacterium]